jgi:hypothetical protein
MRGTEIPIPIIKGYTTSVLRLNVQVYRIFSNDVLNARKIPNRFIVHYNCIETQSTGGILIIGAKRIRLGGFHSG